MGERLEKNMDEIVEKMKTSDMDQKLDKIRAHQEVIMKER